MPDSDSMNMPSRKHRWQLILSFLVSGGLLYYVFRSVEWALLWEALGDISFVWFIPSTFLIVIHFAIRAYRWGMLLPDSEGLSKKFLFDAIMLGNFASFILPLRAGEFIRPLMISRSSHIKFTKAFASLILERFFDLAAVLITFFMVVGAIPGLPVWVGAGASALGTLAGLIFIWIVLSSLYPYFIIKISKYFLAFIPSKAIADNILHFIVELVDSAAVLRKKWRLVQVILYTVIIWISGYVFYFSFAPAMHLNLSFFGATVLSVIIALAVAAPSAPGFIGVYQTACVVSLGLFGIPLEKALAFSLVSHAYQYLLFTLYGVYVLSKYKLSLGAMQEAKELRG